MQFSLLALENHFVKNWLSHLLVSRHSKQICSILYDTIGLSLPFPVDTQTHTHYSATCSHWFFLTEVLYEKLWPCDVWTWCQMYLGIREYEVYVSHAKILYYYILYIKWCTSGLLFPHSKVPWRFCWLHL